MAEQKRHTDVPQERFLEGPATPVPAPKLAGYKKENPAEAGFSITTAVKTISSEA
ncbi:hypothetical protein [Marinobacter vinifirmus]|jgi:hypothetical protein|uniref:hypothetical protein n=2 Tax=Marinobacter TaxID=2742 RepID=UPI001377EC01|nr:hypothetical protein [Marinobacter vinifirmus]